MSGAHVSTTEDKAGRTGRAEDIGEEGRWYHGVLYGGGMKFNPAWVFGGVFDLNRDMCWYSPLTQISVLLFVKTAW